MVSVEIFPIGCIDGKTVRVRLRDGSLDCLHQQPEKPCRPLCIQMQAVNQKRRPVFVFDDPTEGLYNRKTELFAQLFANLFKLPNSVVTSVLPKVMHDRRRSDNDDIPAALSYFFKKPTHIRFIFFIRHVLLGVGLICHIVGTEEEKTKKEGFRRLGHNVRVDRTEVLRVVPTVPSIDHIRLPCIRTRKLSPPIANVKTGLSDGVSEQDDFRPSPSTFFACHEDRDQQKNGNTENR
mmetsp:Transcript_56163/g.109961  ORF Transcript_56163/g.109961 Transcript_56163/m.109961 type:complete len:236 (+) Transcript_56163:134-841(+)